MSAIRSQAVTRTCSMWAAGCGRAASPAADQLRGLCCTVQDVIKQLQLNTRDPRAFVDQLNEAGRWLPCGLVWCLKLVHAQPPTDLSVIERVLWQNGSPGQGGHVSTTG